MERALALIRSRHRSDLPLETFIFSIVHASIRVRKVLLTTTRIQPRSFHSSTRWYRRLSQSLEESFVLHDSTGRCSAEVQTLYDFILNYKELFRTPISAGFTSMLRMHQSTPQILEAIANRSLLQSASADCPASR